MSGSCPIDDVPLIPEGLDLSPIRRLKLMNKHAIQNVKVMSETPKNNVSVENFTLRRSSSTDSYSADVSNVVATR